MCYKVNMSSYLVMALDTVPTIGSLSSLRTCTRLAPQHQMIPAEGPTRERLD